MAETQNKGKTKDNKKLAESLRANLLRRKEQKQQKSHEKDNNSKKNA